MPCLPQFSLVQDTLKSGSLSAGEQAYSRAQKANALPGAFQSYLRNLISTRQDIPLSLKSIFNSNGGASLTYGIAISRGVYCAALYGSEAITTFNGILQDAQYMAGLSGGGCNNTKNQGFIGGLILESSRKLQAGSPVSLTDSFGISLAKHFMNGTNLGNLLDFNSLNGVGQLFSDIAKVLLDRPAFETYNLPFPVVLSTLFSNHGNPNNILLHKVVPLSNMKFEYNIFEFGSYDPNLAAFIPMQTLGMINETSCIVGFDQTAFILGSTGDIFPAVNESCRLTPNDPLVLEFAAGTAALHQIIPQVNIRLDGALIPNPFSGQDKFSVKNEELLTLADRGIDRANLPLQPLLVKACGMQAIIALDASGNTDDNFVDGSLMIAESKCAALFPDAYRFPQIPQTQAEFLSQNLTMQPTFFGCDEDQDTPIMLYFPNGAPPPGKPLITKASTSQLSFPDLGHIQAIINQTGEIISWGQLQNGEAQHGLFPVCVVCALLKGKEHGWV
ncbi:acyl transferase/acyl hydrolase/lysophospholipase [Mycena sp. CBHHK59/15]|nr:acyl transferase/acyl hydrolase/lysophospholipase [Mycena sp. CBHHK59/15]